MLEAWLDFHRANLAPKCSGLKDDQLRPASAAPSSMTLLGLGAQFRVDADGDDHAVQAVCLARGPQSPTVTRSGSRSSPWHPRGPM
ncbi:DUF664 domain-containing protein [Streptomyces sp. NPDC056004]|uniref:mycothiol transferase n=1 Tax=unclassified Streptomyces TaxID=2593676 RepID=UPI0035DB1415